MTVPSVPSFDSLSHLFLDESRCFEYLVAEGILLLEKSCVCGRILAYQAPRKGFRCPSRNCRKSQSVFAGSFFSKTKLPPNKIMHLAYLWLCKSSVTFAMAYTGHSSATICAFFKYFRDLVADSLDEIDYCIGGEDVEVELDE